MHPLYPRKKYADPLGPRRSKIAIAVPGVGWVSRHIWAVGVVIGLRPLVFTIASPHKCRVHAESLLHSSPAPSLWVPALELHLPSRKGC